ncbi:MAG: ABC transporter ATP-binding protein [archaeon GB-1867-035]|nr:ABC transporter ATP-binding protein [Candidatus Culexmicrobium profundum]
MTKKFRIISSNESGKFYRVINAVDNVSFDVEAGDVFGLLGPNGSGKTTLLKLLAGLLYPDEGTAYVCGFDIRDSSHRREVRARVTIIASGRWLGFNPFTSIRKALEQYAYLNGLDSDEARNRVKEALDILGLSEFADESIMFLSSGMRQRALLASALLVRTPIVLLDEPTLGLDIEAAWKFRDIIRKMSKDYGQTVLIATHHMEEAEVLCDKIAILNNGKIVAIGTPIELKRKILGYDILTIRLEKTSTHLLRRISSINGVLKVGIKYLKNNAVELNVQCDYNREVLPDVLKVLIEENCKFTFIERRVPSLEEVFLKLIGGKENV